MTKLLIIGELDMTSSLSGCVGRRSAALSFAGACCAGRATRWALPCYQVEYVTACCRYEEASRGTECLSRESGQPNYVLTLVLAQLLIGIGGSPLYTLGTAYIDNHVDKRKAPSYIGISLLYTVSQKRRHCFGLL